MGNIYLHPEYGLNPTIPVCFYCGEPKNEVALLGRGFKGEAPAHMLLDKVPCDTCMDHMREGILIIGVENDANVDNPRRTGHMFVVKEEAIRELLSEHEDLLESVLGSRIAFMEYGAMKRIGILPQEKEPSDG